MEWVTKAANEWNGEQQRRMDIERGAPLLWENIWRAVQEAVRTYRALQDQPYQVEFSGGSNHTVSVNLYESGTKLRLAAATELGRVKITFNQDQSVIEVHSPGKEACLFPIILDERGQVCLQFEKRRLTPESFTELVLRDVLFPKEKLVPPEPPGPQSYRRQGKEDEGND